MTERREPTLAAAIGRRVREIREGGGYTQDELAGAARRAGLTWTQASVTSLEIGRRGLSADELLLLPLALVFLDGGDHTLAELLDGAPENVTRPTGHPAGTGFLRHMLEGGNAAAAGAVDRWLAAGAGDPDDEEFLAFMASREPERHAGRTLDVPPERVAEVAYKRWGRGLTEEREARTDERRREGNDLSPQRLQALRGHVTRELLREIRDELEGGDDG